MRFLLATIFVCALAASQAQAGFGPFAGLSPYGGRVFGGFPSSQFFQEIVLQSQAQLLLTQPDLPEDLRDRVLVSLSNAELGFSTCNAASAAATLPWLQIRCIMNQLQISKNELKAIEDEAKVRAAATTAAPAVGRA